MRSIYRRRESRRPKVADTFCTSAAVFSRSLQGAAHNHYARLSGRAGVCSSDCSGTRKVAIRFRLCINLGKAVGCLHTCVQPKLCRPAAQPCGTKHCGHPEYLLSSTVACIKHYNGMNRKRVLWKLASLDSIQLLWCPKVVELPQPVECTDLGTATKP